MIAIIDYNLGNPLSIQNMLRRIGAVSIITNNKQKIAAADKLIIPGVGHFVKGMQNLQNSGLIDILNKCVIVDEKPILGICLGMQLMTKHSEEGDYDGLGWVDANTKQFLFNNNSNLKIPHMGWNWVKYQKNNFITNNLLEEEQRYYFVHAYYVECAREEDILGVSDYGHPFTSAFQYKNIIGMQFHPEKSHKFGMKILTNFVNS